MLTVRVCRVSVFFPSLLKQRSVTETVSSGSITCIYLFDLQCFSVDDFVNYYAPLPDISVIYVFVSYCAPLPQRQILSVHSYQMYTIRFSIGRFLQAVLRFSLRRSFFHALSYCSILFPSESVFPFRVYVRERIRSYCLSNRSGFGEVQQ